MLLLQILILILAPTATLSSRLTIPLPTAAVPPDRGGGARRSIQRLQGAPGVKTRENHTPLPALPDDAIAENASTAQQGAEFMAPVSRPNTGETDSPISSLTKTVSIRQVFFQGRELGDEGRKEKVVPFHTYKPYIYALPRVDAQIQLNGELLTVQNLGNYTGFLAKVDHGGGLGQLHTFRPQSLTTMRIEEGQLLIFVENDKILALPDSSTRMLSDRSTTFALYIGHSDTPLLPSVPLPRRSFSDIYGIFVVRIISSQHFSGKKIMDKQTPRVENSILLGGYNHERRVLASKGAVLNVISAWRDKYKYGLEIEEDFDPFLPGEVGYWRMAQRLNLYHDVAYLLKGKRAIILKKIGIKNEVFYLIKKWREDMIREYQHTFNIDIQRARQELDDILNHQLDNKSLIRIIVWGEGIGDFVHKSLGGLQFGVYHLTKVDNEFWEVCLRRSWHRVIRKLLDDHEQFTVVESDVASWIVASNQDKHHQLNLLRTIGMKYAARLRHLENKRPSGFSISDFIVNALEEVKRHIEALQK